MEAQLPSQYPGGRDRIPRASWLEKQPKSLSHPINSVNQEDSQCQLIASLQTCTCVNMDLHRHTYTHKHITHQHTQIQLHTYKSGQNQLTTCPHLQCKFHDRYQHKENALIKEHSCQKMCNPNQTNPLHLMTTLQEDSRTSDRTIMQQPKSSQNAVHTNQPCRWTSQKQNTLGHGGGVRESWFSGIQGSKHVRGPGSRSSPRKKEGRKEGRQSVSLSAW